MSNRKKALWGIFGVWLAGVIVFVALFQWSPKKNSEFQIQNEFKLTNWVHLGVFSINRAVVYLLIAALLTMFTTLWVSRRMHARPNKVQAAVELLFGLMRDNITRGNMPDSMAARWFPFIGALFLFIWFCNLIGYLPLPTNSQEKFNVFGLHIPAFALYAATANVSVPLVLALVVFVAFNTVGIRAQGFGGYLKSLIPSGIHGPILLLLVPVEILSTLMRILSLTVRLFANILAGHMIILFMAGGLAVILGIQVLGWIVLPFGIILYMFELGLVATLQAFIFATLTAIYLGGAVTTH